MNLVKNANILFGVTVLVATTQQEHCFVPVVATQHITTQQKLNNQCSTQQHSSTIATTRTRQQRDGRVSCSSRDGRTVAAGCASWGGWGWVRDGTDSQEKGEMKRENDR